MTASGGPRLPAGVNGFELAAALERLGFEIVRTKGSHQLMRREGGRTFPVPLHRSAVPRGTLRAILRQAGITVQELIDVL